MKYIVAILIYLLVGCASNQTIKKDVKYVPPSERTLFDPKVVDGVLIMPREQWFHNFKASSIPGLCSDPKAKFIYVYKGARKNCEKVVEDILDFCLEKLSGNYIPKEVKGIAKANVYGQIMGSCLLINYQNSVKKT